MKFVCMLQTQGLKYSSEFGLPPSKSLLSFWRVASERQFDMDGAIQGAGSELSWWMMLNQDAQVQSQPC